MISFINTLKYVPSDRMHFFMWNFFKSFLTFSFSTVIKFFPLTDSISSPKDPRPKLTSKNKGKTPCIRLFFLYFVTVCPTPMSSGTTFSLSFPLLTVYYRNPHCPSHSLWVKTLRFVFPLSNPICSSTLSVLLLGSSSLLLPSTYFLFVFELSQEIFVHPCWPSAMTVTHCKLKQTVLVHQEVSLNIK